MHYLLSAEDGVFVARCLELELASDGPTEAQAIANLYEALDLYSEPCLPEPEGSVDTVRR